MKYQDFIGHVQNRAQLGTMSDTVAATRATLETLGERIVTGEAEDLAAQLPREIGYYLRQANVDERFPLSDFYERVATRADVDLPGAVYQARVVMSVVREAVTPGEWDDMSAQLPNEYNELLEMDVEAETA